MGDALGVERFDNTTGHTVVLSIDNVEGLAGIDRSLGDLTGLVGIPAVAAGSFTDDGPVVGCFALLGQRIAAADLSSAAQLALDVQNVILIKLEALQPCNGSFAFLTHIGNNSCSVQARIAVDHTVEQEDLNAGFLGLFENLVPAGGLSSGDQDVLDLSGDEALGGFQLLVGCRSGHESSLIAILFGEGLSQILHVRLAVAGLCGIQVDDADRNQIVCKRHRHNCQTEHQNQSNRNQFFHCLSP